MFRLHGGWGQGMGTIGITYLTPYEEVTLTCLGVLRRVVSRSLPIIVRLPKVCPHI